MTHADLWQRARLARDRVERRVRDRKEVRMVDIGASAAGLPVIQVHVDRAIGLADLLLEATIDGFAIQVHRAPNFHPE